MLPSSHRAGARITRTCSSESGQGGTVQRTLAQPKATRSRCDSRLPGRASSSISPSGIGREHFRHRRLSVLATHRRMTASDRDEGSVACQLQSSTPQLWPGISPHAVGLQAASSSFQAILGPGSTGRGGVKFEDHPGPSWTSTLNGNNHRLGSQKLIGSIAVSNVMRRKDRSYALSSLGWTEEASFC